MASSIPSRLLPPASRTAGEISRLWLDVMLPKPYKALLPFHVYGVYPLLGYFAPRRRADQQMIACCTCVDTFQPRKYHACYLTHSRMIYGQFATDQFYLAALCGCTSNAGGPGQPLHKSSPLYCVGIVIGVGAGVRL
jgi:hypothetical protein